MEATSGEEGRRFKRCLLLIYHTYRLSELAKNPLLSSLWCSTLISISRRGKEFQFFPFIIFDMLSGFCFSFDQSVDVWLRLYTCEFSLGMDILNKNVRGASVGYDQFLAVDDAVKTNLKYQTLLNDYLDLQKEYVSRKRKLQAAKQKRETVWTEVRFLRERHKRLSKYQSPNIHKVVLHLPNSDKETYGLQGKRKRNLDPFLSPYSLVTNEGGEGSGQVHGKNVMFTKKLDKALSINKVEL